MTIRKRNESGETLVEVVLALVIIGVVVSGYFAAITASSTATSTHRNSVTADGILRNYAEATKLAVRNSCTSSAQQFTVNYTTPPSSASNVFSVSPTPATPQQCPSTTATTTVNLAVTWTGQKCFVSGGPSKPCSRKLDIEVRTP